MKASCKSRSLMLLSSVFLLASCTGNPPPSESATSEAKSTSEATTSIVTSSKEETTSAQASSSEEQVTSSEQTISSQETVASSEEAIESSEEATASEIEISSAEIIDSSMQESEEESVQETSDEEDSSAETGVKYNLSVQAPSGYRFDVEGGQHEFKAGDTVTFAAVNTDASRKLTKVYWYASSEPGTLNVLAGNEGVYTFTMPEDDAVIKGDVDRYYSLSVNETGCTVNITSPVKQYYRNDTVTFTVTPLENYEIERVYLYWLEVEEESKGEKTMDLAPLEDQSYSFMTKTGAMTIYAVCSEKSQTVDTDPFTESEYQGDYTSQGYYREHMYLQFKFNGQGKLYWCIYFDKNSGGDDWGEYWEFFAMMGVDLSNTSNFEAKISSKDYIDYTYDTATGNVSFGGNTLKTTLEGGVVTQVKCVNNLGSDGLYSTAGTVCTKI